MIANYVASYSSVLTFDKKFKNKIFKVKQITSKIGALKIYMILKDIRNSLTDLRLFITVAVY